MKKNKPKHTNLKDPADLIKQLQPFQDPAKSIIASELIEAVIEFCNLSQNDIFKYGYEGSIEDPIKKQFSTKKLTIEILDPRIKRINELLALLKPRRQKAFYTRLFKVSPGTLIELIDVHIFAAMSVCYYPPYRGEKGQIRRKEDIGEKCWNMVKALAPDIPNPTLKRIYYKRGKLGIALSLAASLYNCKWSDLRDIYRKAKTQKETTHIKTGPD